MNRWQTHQILQGSGYKDWVLNTENSEQGYTTYHISIKSPCSKLWDMIMRLVLIWAELNCQTCNCASESWVLPNMHAQVANTSDAPTNKLSQVLLMWTPLAHSPWVHWKYYPLPQKNLILLSSQCNFGKKNAEMACSFNFNLLYKRFCAKSGCHATTFCNSSCHCSAGISRVYTFQTKKIEPTCWPKVTIVTVIVISEPLIGRNGNGSRNFRSTLTPTSGWTSTLTAIYLSPFDLNIMSELQPIIPAQQDDGIPASPQETPEPAPITEQEVGEYREQDRFLPVCGSFAFMPVAYYSRLFRLLMSHE